MQKYIYGDVLLYAREHTIKEIQEFFCFPSYGATKRYLLKHNIMHLAESRAGKNNSNYKHGGKHTRLYNIWDDKPDRDLQGEIIMLVNYILCHKFFNQQRYCFNKRYKEVK